MGALSRRDSDAEKGATNEWIILNRASELLRPFMDETRRTTWLTLAFYQDHQALFDDIPKAGATRDFTVNCVRLLLERGCLGSRHALSLLLEVVRDEVGEDRKAGFQSLIDELDRACIARLSAPGPAVLDDGPPPDLVLLRDRVRETGSIPELSAEQLQAILRHSPGDLEEYRLARIAEWSQPRYALDKRFTRLTLLLDQGPDAQGLRWQAQPRTFDELHDLLHEASDPALVLLGPPGCGKSTLLRRLELDLAFETLGAAPHERTPLSFFLPLNRYRPTRAGDPLPLPEDWLAQEWARRYPRLPPLQDLLRSGAMMLLLDAVNEIPHTDEADYRARIGLWRDYLVDLARSSPGTRVLFSCRSLDYSASLSTPELSVPHVRIESLSDPQVEQFLTLYSPNAGPALWAQLRGTPQLDLFRSPFYLRLLLAQADTDGPALGGRAALFTGFVRQALTREIRADNPAFRPGLLLDRRDHERIVRHEWRDALDLPGRGPLLPALCRLAFALQARRAPGKDSRVRAPYDDALALLGGGPTEELLRAGVALQVLEVQWDDVLYLHQLLQEYFAARALAAAPQGLADSDPLTQAPVTGWEETFLLAAAMTRTPEPFVADLAELNLPLAGRSAAQPDVAVSSELRQGLQQALVVRSREPTADLRARIAAARALGELGDPRLERHRGPHGDYLLPPLIPVAAGTYPIGSDEGLYEHEAPAHPVTLDAFSIGQFPVTNAELRCFMEANGYEDERWWETEAARRWQGGEGTAEGPRQQWREDRQSLRANPEGIGQLHREGRITSKQAEDLESIRTMSDTEFEALLADWYPPGRQTSPAYWNDPAYNHPAQPVVGVCWHEARAYCAWLSAQTGGIYRLPTETQWEAAARGPEGRRYPWGETFDPARCNTFETHVRTTTPVGIFPRGDTAQGIADLSGNVWEWTGSVYRPYTDAAESGDRDVELADARRVVRGGSWNNNRGFARCACRSDDRPDNRYNNIGFRVV
jgi:formylglycine-generating enzyme required for sulfatase activity